MSGLLNAEWITVHGLVSMLAVAIFAIGARVRGERRHPSAAMAWVISLALMPYVAIPLYLLLGNRKVVRGRAVPRPFPIRLPATLVDSPSARFQQVAAAMGLPAAAPYEQLAIHADGVAALDALQGVIRSATRTLDVCTFLLGRDALGAKVASLLAESARRGVRVRLLIDGVGRYLGGRPDLSSLTAAGVEVAVFVSPFRSALPGRTNLRNHRKLVIADSQRAWTGGRNLGAEYFTGVAHGAGADWSPPWIDLTVDFAGALAQQAQARFDADWAFATGREAPDAGAEPPAGATVRGGAQAQLIPSGPDQADDTLHALLICSFFTARRRITAVTPYFVPDAQLMLALTLAARRGVDVDLVLPAQSNHRLADLARYAALRDLAAAGARVWLMADMVHAKAILIDDLALVGSANLDERSLFLNYELMIAFYDRTDVGRIGDWMATLRQRGTAYVAAPPGLSRQFTEGVVRWLAFQL